jgi:hypothetical protein
MSALESGSDEEEAASHEEGDEGDMDERRAQAQEAGTSGRAEAVPMGRYVPPAARARRAGVACLTAHAWGSLAPGRVCICMAVKQYLLRMSGVMKDMAHAQAVMRQARCASASRGS